MAGSSRRFTVDIARKWRYRVRRYRIVYEIDARARARRVVAVADRRHIYEQLAARLRSPARSGAT